MHKCLPIVGLQSLFGKERKGSQVGWLKGPCPSGNKTFRISGCFVVFCWFCFVLFVFVFHVLLSTAMSFLDSSHLTLPLIFLACE